MGEYRHTSPVGRRNKRGAVSAALAKKLHCVLVATPPPHEETASLCWGDATLIVYVCVCVRALEVFGLNARTQRRAHTHTKSSSANPENRKP